MRQAVAGYRMRELLRRFSLNARLLIPPGMWNKLFFLF